MRSSQTGPYRQFVTPPLTAGKEYVYQVRVVWQAGAKEVAESRDITVRTGDRLATESFPRAAAE